MTVSKSALPVTWASLHDIHLCNAFQRREMRISAKRGHRIEKKQRFARTCLRGFSLLTSQLSAEAGAMRCIGRPVSLLNVKGHGEQAGALQIISPGLCHLPLYEAV